MWQPRRGYEVGRRRMGGSVSIAILQHIVEGMRENVGSFIICQLIERVLMDEIQ